MISMINLGANPILEPLLPQFVKDYEEESLSQCYRYIDLLRKKFGKEPIGVHLLVVSNAYQYPNLYEVECHFDNENYKAVQYVLNCKLYLPKTWKDSAPVSAPVN